MIIESLLNAIFTLLDGAFSGINIPAMPEGMPAEIVEWFSTILNLAGSMITLIIPWSQIKLFFPILVVVLASEEIYKIVMWIVRKIPMLGIS